MQYLIEVSICLIAFYLFYHFALRKDTLFQRNRFYLLCTSAFALLIPLLELDFAISNDMPTIPLVLESITVSIKQIESQTLLAINIWNWVVFIYWIVVALLLLKFIYEMGYIIWIINTSRPIRKRGYWQINTKGKLPTFSFFNYLFWDDSRQLDEIEADKILNHELTHIWDKHSIDLIYIELLRIFFWFNPVVYLYNKALKFHHEYIADAAVLRESDLQSYGKLIVQTLFRKLNLSLAHNFNQSEIRQRLNMMRKKRTPKYFNFKLIFVFPFLVILLFAFSNKIKEQINLNTKSTSERNRFATAADGLDNFYKELATVLEYPVSARRAGVEGRVFVQFVVMKDGSLDNFKILKGIHPDCDKAAIEAIKKTRTRWLPAKVDGKAVKQEISVPIFFKLN